MNRGKHSRFSVLEGFKSISCCRSVVRKATLDELRHEYMFWETARQEAERNVAELLAGTYGMISDGCDRKHTVFSLCGTKLTSRKYEWYG